MPDGDADASYQAYDLPLHIIFANASCKRGIPAPDFVQCNAPEEQIACRGVSF
ncbi:hypothetical protein P10159_4038 [Citrobacter portucalensis]|nr:hypothetical protein P10159_4038 [Citrobacter portucalensis]